MRLLIDLTNSPHVPFFVPLVRALREDGHDVDVTARQFAQTVELARLHRLDATVIGAHGGTTRAGKARAAIARTWSLDRHVARKQKGGARCYDAALSHGSTDLPIVARRRGIPHVTIFDYEWAATQHRTNVRHSWRVVVPEAIALERLDAYGAAGRVSTYPGLKEEYYLDPGELDPRGVRSELGVPEDAVLIVLRPPADMALYHRGIVNGIFADVLERARMTAGCRAVVLPRTRAQRTALMSAAGRERRIIIPTAAVDGASLVASADVVVSAGGTMNREAAALGVPVYTVFAGRMGGVDEALLASGRLKLLTSAADVPLKARAGRDGTPKLTNNRDPRDLLNVLLAGLPTNDRSDSRTA